jgi:hypothetical protein
VVGRQVQVGEQLLPGRESLMFISGGLLTLTIKSVAANTSSAVSTTPLAAYSAAESPSLSGAGLNHDLRP